MGTRSTTVSICDRCPRETPATDSVKICYEDTTYTLDLCTQHSTMMERDLLGWIRLGREAECQSHGNQTWVPGARYTTRTNQKAIERLEQATVPTAPVADIEPATDVEPRFEEPVSALRPTMTGNEAMAKHGVDWPTVVAAVENAGAVTPSKMRDDVHTYLSEDLSVLVAEDGSVIGLTRRDPGEPLPRTPDHLKRRIVRKGKRGGQGNIGPRSIEEILAAIEATPGWRVDNERRHYAVHGPNGERSTIPKTNSDWRGPMNVLSDLRKIGLDLRAQARAAS